MSSADPAAFADDFPSPEPSNAHLPSMDMSSELANQALAQQADHTVIDAGASSHPDQAPPVESNNGGIQPDLDHTLTHPSEDEQSPYKRARFSHPGQSTSYRAAEPLSNAEQLVILRRAYVRNPHPGKRELEALAERTGRPWNKIREYFRQRRTKMRGLDLLEEMEEPGRASGWLQILFRAAPATSHISQLYLYNSYKTRFDPYSAHSPLLGGQELVQLACATFPNTEMAKLDEDYIIRGMAHKDEAAAQGQATVNTEKRIDDLVEPLRGTGWLLSTFQHQPEADIAQTDLYASYAARFTDLPETSNPGPTDEAELREFEAEMAAPDQSNGIDDQDLNPFSLALGQNHGDEEETLHHHTAAPPKREERLLNPVELISLVKMTFPHAEPAVDEAGRFVIRGIERREGEEKSRGNVKSEDMFPFALAAAPDPSDANHPFTSLLKRKLAALHPDPSDSSESARRARRAAEALGEEEKELLQGLKRFKSSPLGREVRDICVSQ